MQSGSASALPRPAPGAVSSSFPWWSQTKVTPAETIRAAVACGLEHCGESYVKEALPKIETLTGLELTWHFIGQLQANKTRPVAENFAWVHGVDRLRIAERLSAQRPYHAPLLNVCVQVKIGGELSK